MCFLRDEEGQRKEANLHPHMLDTLHGVLAGGIIRDLESPCFVCAPDRDNIE